MIPASVSTTQNPFIPPRPTESESSVAAPAAPAQENPPAGVINPTCMKIIVELNLPPSERKEGIYLQLLQANAVLPGEGIAFASVPEADRLALAMTISLDEKHGLNGQQLHDKILTRSPSSQKWGKRSPTEHVVMRSLPGSKKSRVVSTRANSIKLGTTIRTRQLHSIGWEQQHSCALQPDRPTFAAPSDNRAGWRQALFA